MILMLENSITKQLLTIMSKAVSAANGRACVQAYLTASPVNAENIYAVSIGKAAQSMMQGVLDQGVLIKRGLLISKHGHLNDITSLPPSITCLAASHPYPGRDSLEAGKALLDFIQRVPENGTLLFLISGGTSSLVEVLAEGVTLEELERLSHWLMTQGLPIDVMNRVRKSVSCIKAGRLARHIKARRVIQLLISDVPGDDISVIGSGLLVPESADSEISVVLPVWVEDMKQNVPLAPTASDEIFHKITSVVIANNELTRNIAQQTALDMGLTVQSKETMTGDIYVFGNKIAKQIRQGERGIYIWGGEGTIRLPEKPGTGGRAQALALTVAVAIKGREDIVLLAVGTDGTDGPSDVAGAMIDGQTIMRGIDAGYDPEVAMGQADAGRFLATSGDLIDTGPTGTNVMDLVIAVKY